MSDDIRHRFLIRQLKRQGLAPDKMPSDLKKWMNFIKSIESVYEHHDDDRYLLERSLRISSEEMQMRLEKEKAMSLQLAQAGKMVSIGTLASGVAHELNNPLAIIKGFLEILIEDQQLSDDSRKRIEKIEQLSNRMELTIKHLLKMSRQSKEGTTSTYGVAAAINDCIELLKKQFEFDNIKIHIDNRTKDSDVKGSATQLISVFQNLLTNSRDAFFEAPSDRDFEIKITISHSPDNKSFLVNYSDNAGGMDEEAAQRAFDPFYSTKEVGQGTGLGLSIAKQIILELGGSINLLTNPGVGTTFNISLPVYVEKDEPTSVVEQVSKEGASKSLHSMPTTHLNALIVDDEPDICELLTGQMSEYYNVTSTTSSTEACGFLKKNQYDLLVTDLRMPNLSGDDLAHLARQLHKPTKVVVISGHLHGKELDGLQRIEPFLFIEKPFRSLAAIVQDINNFVHEPS